MDSKLARIALLALSVLALALFAGCEANTGKDKDSASKETEAYPASVRKNFITSCDQAGGTKKQCTDLLDCIEPKVTYDKFETADAAVRKTGKTPAWYTKVQDACITEVTGATPPAVTATTKK